MRTRHRHLGWISFNSFDDKLLASSLASASQTFTIGAILNLSDLTIPPELQTILRYQIGDNTVATFALALAVFLVIWFSFWIFQIIILKRLKQLAKQTKTDFDDTLIDLIEEIPSWFYRLIALYIGLKFITLGEQINWTIDAIFIITIIYRAVLFLQHFIAYSLGKLWARTPEEQTTNQTALRGVQMLANITLWAAGLLLVLANLGFEVNALIAGLGVGGIAIAFALQNILGDLFSSFAIYFDRPFEIGDYITVGERNGIVKKIGLKTTRITALQGEEIVISNQELTNSQIQNFKKMEKRRVLFAIGVTYCTSAAKLKKIPSLVEKAVVQAKKCTFDRCHFKEFGDFSLNFEIVYYFADNDYTKYLDARQEINLAIREFFEKEKIEMAFPTQTVILQK